VLSSTFFDRSLIFVGDHVLAAPTNFGITREFKHCYKFPQNRTSYVQVGGFSRRLKKFPVPSVHATQAKTPDSTYNS